MELKEILRLQYEFDSRHGWNPEPNSPNAVLRAVQDDVIGIVGEIGELANIVKKVALEVGRDGSLNPGTLLDHRRADLAEELVDAFIYLIRLASHLKVDVEAAYLGKLKINEHRFTKYENPQS